MALTEREKQILRLREEGLSDYKIARELKCSAPNVNRSRKAALLKIERAKTDLEYIKNIRYNSAKKTG